jgi:hypothetical protein
MATETTPDAYKSMSKVDQTGLQSQEYCVGANPAAPKSDEGLALHANCASSALIKD